ncbi:MAG: trypsin-like peptidase domain-containing protein [Planctomycetes bacterium]|nr:trypsin-like peptidase domain-containing protein [Planctomycetota bacterium]
MKTLAALPLLALLGCAAPPSAPAQQPPAEREPLLEDVFARVQSAVVTIRTASRSVDPVAGRGLTAVAGLGSGVVIGADGSILTAAHVVHTADVVDVEFTDGERALAEVVASDLLNDVALIRTVTPPPAATHIAVLGDSDRVPVGRRVFVVGAPLGLTHSLTVGHVSARRAADGPVRNVYDAERFQTDAAINEGNSGGPMFDLRGEVIGIVSHLMSRTGGSDGLGFAVTSNVCRRLLLEGDAFWSGVEVVVLTGELARVFNLPQDRSGLLVQRVASRSPAARLGLLGGELRISIQGQDFVAGGDVILAVQGIEVGERGSQERVREALRRTLDGEELRVEVLRAGERLELHARVAR